MFKSITNKQDRISQLQILKEELSPFITKSASIHDNVQVIRELYENVSSRLATRLEELKTVQERLHDLTNKLEAMEDKMLDSGKVLDECVYVKNVGNASFVAELLLKLKVNKIP